MMDTGPLAEAYRELLEAAVTVAGAGPASLVVPAGEWDADRILAHVALVTAATIAAASSVAAGVNTTYDNRLASDAWTVDRVVAVAGGGAGLRERVRRQGAALCALGGPALSAVELDTLVPARLVSNGSVLVDEPVRLRDLLAGLAGVELPGHTRQLLALLPAGVRSADV
jgi:hypothetical protein